MLNQALIWGWCFCDWSASKSEDDIKYLVDLFVKDLESDKLWSHLTILVKRLNKARSLINLPSIEARFIKLKEEEEARKREGKIGSSYMLYIVYKLLIVCIMFLIVFCQG